VPIVSVVQSYPVGHDTVAQSRPQYFRPVASVRHLSMPISVHSVSATHGLHSCVDVGTHTVRFVCDGVMETAVYARDGTRLLVCYRGETFAIEDHTRAASVRQDAARGGDGKLRASMNGRVVAVLVATGDRVTTGQPMVTLEAMKMEHVHAAPLAGVVKAVNVAVGEQIPALHIVAEIEPDGETAKAS